MSWAELQFTCPFEAKETRILDPMSQEVLAETWSCTGGPNYERGTWVSKAYDEWQHPMLMRTSKGEKSEASWGGNCCGKEWEIGADGTELDYSYDLLGRMIRITKPSTTTNAADLVRNYTYDSEGRRLTEILACGSLTQLISCQGDRCLRAQTAPYSLGKVARTHQKGVGG